MISDRTFSDYRRVLREGITADQIEQQIAKTTPSNKFVWRDGGWHTAPYPGVTIITPPFCDDVRNHALYVALADIQQELVRRLDGADIGLLPPSSLHLTAADLLAAQRYSDYAGETNAEEKLWARLATVFADMPPMPAPRLRVAGLSAYGTAVTVVLDFAGEEDYASVIRLRDAVYTQTGEPIRRLAPFMAHISLFYKQPRSESGKKRLVSALTNMNAETNWPELLPFIMHSADLRYFPDMSRFVRQPGWPRYTFRE